MKKLIFLSMCFLALVGCKKEPNADFSVPSLTKVGQTIQFTNLSAHSTSFKWNFGDGSTSIEKSPAHTFAKPGEYIVTLDVTGDNGSASTNKTLKITGTTYSFKNNCAYSLPSFCSYFWDGSHIQDFVSHGTLAIGGETQIVITDRDQIMFGFQLLGTTYVGTDAFVLIHDKHNVLIITNSTQIYGKSSSLKGIEHDRELSAFKSLMIK
jgi:PKD repeat protein